MVVTVRQKGYLRLVAQFYGKVLSFAKLRIHRLFDQEGGCIKWELAPSSIVLIIAAPPDFRISEFLQFRSVQNKNEPSN